MSETTNQTDTNVVDTPSGIPKFTFGQWVKHPTTILLICVTIVAWIIGGAYAKNQLDQVNYLKERIAVLEQREQEAQAREEESKKELEAYVRTLLFKEAQINMQKEAIENLKSAE